MISRDDIFKIALSVQNITNINSWHGVNSYCKNDENWKSLERHQKVNCHLFVSYHVKSTANEKVRTIAKITTIVALFDQKSGDHDQIIKLLLKACSNSSKQVTKKKPQKDMVDDILYIQIAIDIANKSMNFSSQDTFELYAMKYGVKIGKIAQNHIIKRIIDQRLL